MTLRWAACVALVLLPGAAGLAADRHLGVATCAGSACHGASRMGGGTVRRDEYQTWQRDDRHARAYATLRSERSRKIAANLGLGDPVEARDCLVCHADAAPAAERGDRFQLSDGVGCETCHGAAERWLSPHTRGYGSHRERLAAGLYPTWEPKARAELCLSCHQGDASRPMTHAIMGAGHPPLLFELDTFGALQPPHYEVDADYVKRKNRPDDARNWAVGQVVAARGVLTGAAAATGGEGLFPELVWFDCNACHHPMQPPRWQATDAALPPGRVRVSDNAMYFTGLWLDVVKPELASKWRESVKAVHASTQRAAGDLKAQAAAAQQLLDAEILPLATSQEMTPAQVRALALAVLERGAGARVADFSVAEQTAMASAVFTTALAGGAAKAPKPVRDAIDAVYAAVANRNTYDPEKMRVALVAARDVIAKTYK
jgi:hypothetical protein